MFKIDGIIICITACCKEHFDNIFRTSNIKDNEFGLCSSKHIGESFEKVS